MASNIGYERRKAVANAWKKEKSLVSGGLGTRDWSQKEQKEILSKGRATGYEGHHMKSVDGHNSRAGDANNIQFLNRKEHFAAHSGDFHNNTNGFYDHKTGEMHSFGRNKPSIEAKKLSDPLSQKQVDKLTKKRAGFFKSAGVSAYMGTAYGPQIDATREKARSMSSRSVNKTSAGASESKTLRAQRSAKTTSAKGSETQSKTLSKQRSAPSTSRSSGRKQSKNHGH